MEILIVEDDDAKRDRLAAFLSLEFGHLTVRYARSVNSAIDRLLEHIPDLILLDMSLPTYDIGPGERGGRPQGFGGMEVLSSMERFEIKAPVLIVTQYEAFAHEGEEINHIELSDQLASAFPDMFAGLIYFNTVFGEWEDLLTDKVEQILQIRRGV